MEKYIDLNLQKYNTLRIASKAKEFYIPQNINELISLVKDFNSKSIKYYLLAAGSNIVFGDVVNRPVIYLMKMDDELKLNSDGLVESGSSVRIHTLIRFMQDFSLGGIEYLFSVPSSVGGAVYMNAGRGKKYNQSISDFVCKVDYFDGNEIKSMEVENDMFRYRNSIFQDNGFIILKVYFSFPSQDKKITESKIHERLEHSKQYLDTSYPSCGSVFSKGNPILHRILKGYRYGGAKFSKKTPNWISNFDNATYYDVIKLVNISRFLHRCFLQKCNLELKIFND